MMKDQMTKSEFREYQRTGKIPGTEQRPNKSKYCHVREEIKPLSVNEAWQGKRFKTDSYKAYERVLLSVLPDVELPDPPYEIYFKFGFSSPLSDWDNPIKPLQDVIQKRYGFNDKLIKRAIVDVVDVKRGGEFFEFKITTKK